jgi:hypothetical protein
MGRQIKSNLHIFNPHLPLFSVKKLCIQPFKFIWTPKSRQIYTVFNPHLPLPSLCPCRPFALAVPLPLSSLCHCRSFVPVGPLYLSVLCPCRYFGCRYFGCRYFGCRSFACRSFATAPAESLFIHSFPEPHIQTQFASSS